MLLLLLRDHSVSDILPRSSGCLHFIRIPYIPLYYLYGSRTECILLSTFPYVDVMGDTSMIYPLGRWFREWREFHFSARTNGTLPQSVRLCHRRLVPDDDEP